MIWKPVKSAVRTAADVYRTQTSVIGALGYFARLLSRRGPQALRRRIETRRSLARITATTSRPDKIVIAVMVGGVVGDNIVAARFLRDLNAACMEVMYDVYTANVELAKWIYAGVPGLRECFQDNAFDTVQERYDASLVFGDTIRSLRFQPNAAETWSNEFKEIIKSISEFSKEHSKENDVVVHLYNDDGVIAQDLFYKHGANRARANHVIARIAYGGDRYPLSAEDSALARFSLAGKKFVTVHNGFDVKTVTASGSTTKVYPKYGEVITALRSARPDLIFVQIGAATSVVIEEVDINLLGKTTLKEAAGIVRASACHIDNESGIVSIASCFGTPCCVVFGPSSADYFTYEGNAAVRPIECGGCWWIAADWMSRCPRGMNEPVCMYSQPPAMVAQTTLQLLAATNR